MLMCQFWPSNNYFKFVFFTTLINPQGVLWILHAGSLSGLRIGGISHFVPYYKNRCKSLTRNTRDDVSMWRNQRGQGAQAPSVRRPCHPLAPKMSRKFLQRLSWGRTQLCPIKNLPCHPTCPLISESLVTLLYDMSFAGIMYSDSFRSKYLYDL